MLKLIFHSLIALMLVVSCECKDMHIRRMPEEKDIAFKGEVKKPQKAVYRKGESREIQVHLTSSDEEAQDAQFKILSATLADGSPADLDYTSLKLGDNTLSYTPKGPGTHALTIKVAVEGEEESAQTLHYTLEAPAANWQVRGTANETGNLTIHIADVPEEIQGESWRITNTTFGEGLEGRIENMPTRLNHGDNNLNVILDQIVLQEEEPYVSFTIQGPDSETRTCQIYLTTLCEAQLRGTLSGEEQSLVERLANVDAYVQETEEFFTRDDEGIYHLPEETVSDPRANRDKRREVGTLLGRIEAFQTQYQEDIQTFEHSLETLEQTQVNENVPVFEAKNKRLKDAIASLKSAQVQLQQQCSSAHMALFKTLENEEQEAIDILLDDPRLDVNKGDCKETSLLHLAILKGNTAAVSNLIRLRANVEEKEEDYTPLQRSILSKNVGITRLLIDAGADLYAYEKHGLNDFDFMIDQFSYPPFLLACMLMYNEVYTYEENEYIDDVWLDLVRTLIEAGVDTDIRYERLIPVQEYIQTSSINDINELRELNGKDLREQDEYIVQWVSFDDLEIINNLEDICDREEITRLENILDLARENRTLIRPLRTSRTNPDLPPDWQLQGSYDAPSQQLALTIGNTPGRVQQEREPQAQWRITTVTWSEGLSGQIDPNLVLQHGENRIPLSIEMITLAGPPSLTVLVQGPDNARQVTNVDLREVCIVRLRDNESALAERTERVNAYVQETDAAYNFTPENVKANTAKITTLLGRLTAFKTQYQADLQAFSSNLDTLNQAEVNTNLPVFKANNQRLKDAIFSLKSAQVQLQQQCTTAHEAFFKMIATRRTWDWVENEAVFLTLLKDPRFDVNRKNEHGWSVIHWVASQGTEAAVRVLLDNGARVNVKNNQGETALHKAAIFGKNTTVQTLLDSGARVDEQSNSGHTALHWAAHNGEYDVVRVLLDNGARVNVKNNRGETALVEAKKSGHTRVITLLN